MRIRWMAGSDSHKGGYIHGMKQLSIRCNMIEHWVHLRYTGIRLAQYTDTCTCHPHKESGLTTHTYITPPHISRPWSNPPTHAPPTPPQPNHIHTSNTPPASTGFVEPKPKPLIHSPPHILSRPEPNTVKIAVVVFYSLHVCIW